MQAGYIILEVLLTNISSKDHNVADIMGNR